MNVRITIPFLAALLPAWALAHGGPEEAVKTPRAPVTREAGHDAQTAGGHAAALGRPGDPARAGRTITVRMGDDMRYVPDHVEVKRGETVRFLVRNEGGTRHEMVLGTRAELQEHAALMRRFPDMEHDDPNAVSVEPGKTGEFAWTFTRDGRFDFACLIPGHFEAGMRGKITVER